MNVSVIDLAGGAYGQAAHAAPLSPAGDLYMAAFVKPAGASGVVFQKSGAAANVGYSLRLIPGIATFTASADGTAVTLAVGPAVPAGQWSFVEVCHDAAADQIKVAVTSASSASVGSWGTPVAHAGGLFASTAALTLGADHAGANALALQCHSLVLSGAVPTDTQRDQLFGAGSGRRFWEVDESFWFDVIAWWPLDEATSPRASKKGTYPLSTVGSDAVATRSITLQPSGPDAAVRYRLRQLIASCRTFQDWAGVSTESAAMPFIDADFAAPFNDAVLAVILGGANQVRDFSTAYASGAFLVDLYAPALGGTASSESRMEFLNRLGRLRQEMMANSQEGGRLIARSVDVVEDVQEMDPKQTGSPSLYFKARISVPWGARSA